MTAFPKPTTRPRKKPQGLSRKTRLRARGNTSHARRPRDQEYMGKVAAMACLGRLLPATGYHCQGRVNVHHAFGRYATDSDRKTIPLCEACHRNYHNHSGVFAGWSKERRKTWSTWAVEFVRLEVGEP